MKSTFAPALIAIAAVSAATAQTEIFSESFDNVTISGQNSYINPQWNTLGFAGTSPNWTTPTVGELARDFTPSPGGTMSVAVGFDGFLDPGDYAFSVDYNFDFTGETLNAGAELELFFQTLDWKGGLTNIVFANAMPLNSANLPTDSTDNHAMTLFSQAIALDGEDVVMSGTFSIPFTITNEFTSAGPANADEDHYLMAIRLSTPGNQSDTAIATFDNWTLSQVPEPAAAAFLGATVALAAIARRRR